RQGRDHLLVFQSGPGARSRRFSEPGRAIAAKYGAGETGQHVARSPASRPEPAAHLVLFSPSSLFNEEHMRNRFVLTGILALIAMIAGPAVLPASAQNRLGGHMGFVLPLVARANGTTTTISDDFVIGFPVGITVRKSDKFAFDLELVPNIQN